MTVATLNEQRQILFKQTTGIKTFTLSKTEEVPLMNFDKVLTFPAIISANILFVSPEDATVLETDVQREQ